MGKTMKGEECGRVIGGRKEERSHGLAWRRRVAGRNTNMMLRRREDEEDDDEGVCEHGTDDEYEDEAKRNCEEDQG